MHMPKRSRPDHKDVIRNAPAPADRDISPAGDRRGHINDADTLYSFVGKPQSKRFGKRKHTGCMKRS